MDAPDGVSEGFPYLFWITLALRLPKTRIGPLRNLARALRYPAKVILGREKQ